MKEKTNWKKTDTRIRDKCLISLIWKKLLEINHNNTNRIIIQQKKWAKERVPIKEYTDGPKYEMITFTYEKKKHKLKQL